MLEQMASLLYENGLTKLSFLKTEFSFSFHGISFSVKGDKEVSSVHVYLSKLLEYYKKKNIHVLVAIDDVAKNKGMMEFIRAFQGFLIDHYDVRLLMTGLHKNISKLEEDRSLTFLFRAPKLHLPPLSLLSIANSYQNTFSLNEVEAAKLAKITNGYAMAYQLLGDILFRLDKKELDHDVIKEYDQKLSEWSYELIWLKLTEKEKQILTCIAKGKSSNVEILETLNMTKGNLAIYKKNLADEGLIDVSLCGKSKFVLPRFDKFILTREMLYGD